MEPENPAYKLPPSLAAFDRRNAELADWKRMQPWLVPTVKSFDDYVERTTTGAGVAMMHLWNDGSLNPRPELIAEAHGILFDEVRTDAGKFRQPGQQVMFGSGRDGADPRRIPVELSRLHAEMAELLANSRSVADDCAALAHYHVRFIAIHPFMDGNGRTGRAILQAQAQSMGQVLDVRKLAIEKRRYHDALGTAIETNNLVPLTRLIGETIGHEVTHVGELKAHATIRCRTMLHFEDVKSLEEERAWAKTGEALALPSVRAALGQTARPEELPQIIRDAEQMKERYRTASASERLAILTTIEGKVRALGGSDLTLMGVRVAMRDFVRGDGGDRDLLVHRLSAHIRAKEINAQLGIPEPKRSNGLGFSR